MSQSGELIVFYGCMFSGKTTALIDYISQRQLKPNEFIVLKPEIDFRAGKNKISTHDGKVHDCIAYSSGMELQDLISPFTKLIAIDEAQFFDKLILSELRRYLNKGIDVAVSGLDKDYRARPFGIIPNLIEMAHHKHHLKAVCQQCGADAEYSYRMTQNHVLVLIGAENHYEPRCEKCFDINQ